MWNLWEFLAWENDFPHELHLWSFWQLWTESICVQVPWMRKWLFTWITFVISMPFMKCNFSWISFRRIKIDTINHNFRVKAFCRLFSDRCEITVANQSILFFVDWLATVMLYNGRQSIYFIFCRLISDRYGP